jgi:MFS transporter, FHS family, L-fucose permease
VKKNSSLSKLMPVLFGFFIMGFVDVVGIATNYTKTDFNLSDKVANLLPMMVFLWFLILSVPTGLLMNKIGRRQTVILSNIITFVAMLIPLVSYNYITILLAFALLGIGNTLIQVALNPLLTNVVSGKQLTSSLTLGQFIKAIASFLGPIIAGQASTLFGNWKYLFPIFALLTALSTIWLMATKIEEEKTSEKTTSYISCFKLLNDKLILLFFIGILAAVGLDVGLNTTIPKLLMERFELAKETAGYGTSLYFAARTIGAFLGAILLTKIAGRKLFIGSMILGILAMVLTLFIGNLWVMWILIFILGFTIANVFPIIFSAALKRMPDSHNEVSGLLIMGVSGGAIFPVIMGVISDATASQAGGLGVLLIALVYLFFTAFKTDN